MINRIKRSQIVLLLLVSAFGSTLWAGGSSEASAPGALEEEIFPLEGFDSIMVSSAIELQLAQHDNFAVVAEANSEALDRLHVEVQGSTLNIWLDSAGFHGHLGRVRIGVVMPRLKSLELHGASTCEVEFAQKAPVSIQLSGAARITGRLDMPDLRIGAHGASRLEGMDIQGRGLELELQGASRYSGTAWVKEFRVVADGASSLELEGEASTTWMELNGSSRFDAPRFAVENLVLHLSGASKALCTVSFKAEVKASGASIFQYIGDPAVSMDLSGASRVHPYQR